MVKSMILFWNEKIFLKKFLNTEFLHRAKWTLYCSICGDYFTKPDIWIYDIS